MNPWRINTLITTSTNNTGSANKVFFFCLHELKQLDTKQNKNLSNPKTSAILGYFTYTKTIHQKQ